MMHKFFCEVFVLHKVYQDYKFYRCRVVYADLAKIEIATLLLTFLIYLVVADVVTIYVRNGKRRRLFQLFMPSHFRSLVLSLWSFQSCPIFSAVATTLQCRARLHQHRFSGGDSKSAQAQGERGDAPERSHPAMCSQYVIRFILSGAREPDAR